MEKGKIKKEYKVIYQQIREILVKYDTMGIFSGSNIDEYDPEVSAILPKLRNCKSEKDALTMVYQVFLDYFDGCDIGLKRAYAPIAKEIWKAWEDYSKPKSELGR